MKPEHASAVGDALAETGHPRLDYRSDEARGVCARWRPFLETVVFPGCRALDLGCGAGKSTFQLEELGATAVGLDCSRGMLGLAREVAAAIGSAAEFHLGTFERIPFPADSFDLVWFPNNIIECGYEEFDGIVRQVASVLRPGGRFCLTMRDGLERIAAGAETPQGFDLRSGAKELSITPTDRAAYPYGTAFWTTGFACFVASRHLRFARMAERIHGSVHALVFEKAHAAGPSAGVPA